MSPTPPLDHVHYLPLGVVRAIVIANSNEAAIDLGHLAGYTPDTTGLPTSFHENVSKYFSMELDFWRTVDDAIAEIQKNPKAGRAKLSRTHDQLRNLMYATSLLQSSWEDMTKIAESQAERNVALAKSIEIEAQFDVGVTQIARYILLCSTLLLLLLACIGLVNQIQIIITHKSAPK